MSPHVEGYLPFPLVEGKYLLQPCVEGEGERMSEDNRLPRGPLLSQKLMDFILPRTMMSRMVLPIDGVEVLCWPSKKF
jgi:hypothetical protein